MGMETDVENAIKRYQDNGWVFKYEPGTKFIGTYHPRGGKQSICELVHHFEPDAFGMAIAEFLNKRTSSEMRLKGLLAGWKSISKSFKDKNHPAPANIIDGCISDLEALMSIDSDLAPLLKNEKKG